MLAELQTFVNQNQLFKPQNSILIAVSGGIDSVVLCYLFSMANWKFGVAHCNFQLRGRAADEDEQFVQQLAKELSTPFYNIQFDTQKIAEAQKASIQLVARELRYDWLEQIRVEQAYDYIATAHHLNDSIETGIYNFAKGTGIRGLTGIPIKNNRIIRPLHFATKQEIQKFAKENNIEYRMDSSNADAKYNRNKIRHFVIPALQTINPNLEYTAKKTFQNLQATTEIFDWAIEQMKQQSSQIVGETKTINLKKISDFPYPTTVLYEIIKDYNFNADQAQQILESQATGKQFFSDTHEALINRHLLMIRPKVENVASIYWINTDTNYLSIGEAELLIKKTPVPSAFLADNNWAVLDYDTLKFPLILRRWKAGDHFQPLGMRGKKQKIQDFFSNNKVSRFAKEKVWILESNGEICWIIGHRIDERFKITATTQQCLTLHYQLIQPETIITT